MNIILVARTGFVSLFCLFTFLAPSADAQGNAGAESEGRRLLMQMMASAGWNASSRPADIVATGTVVVDKASGPEAKKVTLKARHGRRVRAEFPQSGTLLVVDGDAASLRNLSEIKPVQPSATLSMMPWVFPFFSEHLDLDQSDLSVEYLGKGVVAGEATYRLRLQRVVIGDGPVDKARSLASDLLIELSEATLLPLRIEYPLMSVDNPTSALRLTCYLGDYRRVGSALVPFRFEQFAGDRHLYTLRLESVQLNTGLPDTEFQVP